MRPSNSTIASVGIGIPAATVIAWAVEAFAGVAIPGAVEAALGALISALAGYFFRGGRASDNNRETPEEAARNHDGLNGEIE